jgi:hypothetical protein
LARNYAYLCIVEILLATTKLFIESGNVYIEMKRNADPCIVFYASLRGRMVGKSGLLLILTNPDFLATRPRRDALLAGKCELNVSHLVFRAQEANFGSAIFEFSA